MRMTKVAAGLLLIIANVSASTHLNAMATENKEAPPKASKEEAQIVHWQMPDIQKRFMDIPELASPFIDSSPNDLGDGIPVGSLMEVSVNTEKVIALAKEMATGQHGNYDSLLIAQNGRLVFESYFKRGRVNLSHPQSSATKSYTSLALGRAIQMGYLSTDDLKKPLLSFFDLDPAELVEGSQLITLEHALTMTTGIQISEQGWQTIYRDQQRVRGQGEVQAILEDSAPITPDTQIFKYGTGPQLVMQVIENAVPGSAQAFIDKELLGKLGITNYDWKTAPSGLPESGWKTSLTARDMLKLGLLMDNLGKWNAEQLISQEYLQQATQRQILTGDDDIYGGGDLVSNQGYGYFFWGTDLELNGQKHYAFSAQGGGGMYILLIRDFNLVIVVTAHEREDTTQQLIAERILPIFLAAEASND